MSDLLLWRRAFD